MDKPQKRKQDLLKASRLGTSEALSKAKANQQVAAAKFQAAGQLATAVIGAGNMSTTGFDPNNLLRAVFRRELLCKGRRFH